MNAVTSVSTSANLPDFATLRDQIQKNACQLREIVRRQLDYHSHTLGLNGIKLQRIRNSKELEGIELNHLPSTPSDKTGLLFVKRLYIQSVNISQLACMKFWMEFQEILDANALSPSQAHLNVIEVRAKETLVIIKKPIPELGNATDINAPMKKVVTKRETGMPPRNKECAISYPLPLGKTQKELNEYFKGIFEDFKNKILGLVTYTNDPNEVEYLLVPRNWELNAKMNTAIIHYEMKATAGKAIAACEKREALARAREKESDLEKISIDLAVARLQKWVTLEGEMALAPKPQSAVTYPSLVETYSMAESIKKPVKKKNPLSLADQDKVNSPASPVKEPERALLRPPIVVSDKEVYATFLTLIGVRKEKISWDDAIYCLGKLGFSITQTSNGGNTWKFKWKENTSEWLRDKKTAEELAETISVTSSCHEPHHNGLTTRGPLDSGRLSSFRDLLEECCFTETSVVLA